MQSARHYVSRFGPLWVACVVLASGGCARFWDTVTSRNFRPKHLWERKDPMEVIRNSEDGAERGRALAALKEPKANGGSKKDQDDFIQLMAASANHDREPLCRLGAIRALARSDDPRAVRALEDAYLQRLPFTPEMNSLIRQQCLTALSETEHPDARHLLIRVARQPAPAGEASFQERQRHIDERLTAVRGLSNFKQYDSVEALIYVLESEKDVALRDRAHGSLKLATGKSLPDDAKVWRSYVHDQETPEQPNIIQRVINWTRGE